MNNKWKNKALSFRHRGAVEKSSSRNSELDSSSPLRGSLGMTSRAKSPTRDTSWEKSSKWYKKIVGDLGHYYHEHVILPRVLRILNLKQENSVLDIGCGEGVLGRQVPKNIYYQGVDSALSLIKSASQKDQNPAHRYSYADATQKLPLAKKDFTHATIILALQNMENSGAVLKNTALHLKSGAKLVIVFNHPCFRIPRQSGWDVSPQNNMQYRWIYKYMSEMKIPIKMHPGKDEGKLTWSFHKSLSAYTQNLKDAGFMIENIEEWVSDKKSTSRERGREDTARAEIPLFMCIVTIKK